MSEFVRGLKCRLCGKTFPKEPLNFCTEDFGPLEVDYDYDAIAEALSRSKIGLRPNNMWRFRELLPLDGEPTVGSQVGGTPLVRADRLADALGVERLWIKNDAVNFPTLSFKDRVVSVALSKAREFGFQTVGCASTGNLANSVAANAAAAGLESYIFVPADLEKSKILGTSIYGARLIGVSGTYDEVNRLCTQVAFKYGWGFVNINLRPFYAEGSKSLGFEIAEQLGWRTPQHVVVPMAGGSLIGKVQKAFQELARIGLIADGACKIHGAQATGCNPITSAVKSGADAHRPVRRPNTIAKSLAIGDPADGYFAIKVIRGSGGWAEDVSDAEIADAMILLGRTEGIFAETAGGVTVAVARKLIEQERIGRDEEIVLCITGNGLKTQEAVAEVLKRPAVIKPSLAAFEALIEGARETALVS
ncbi:MAG: threonine synthase [Planctomycetota bacterium]|nr:MAG: threonine synthase [Planctomycetota bacterium]HMC63904.1 threonine synthase [Gemmataceae bacterium]